MSIRPRSIMEAITKAYACLSGEEIDTTSGRGSGKVPVECVRLEILLVTISVRYNLSQHSSGDFESADEHGSLEFKVVLLPEI